ncbi:MAG TPA: hypothetical protein VKE41_19375, partial [Roseiflexaceae bacterium]|nr:hypothetical protein [Roseiflexaceae bacterium]
MLQESKPDDACGTAAHALYLAEMLAVFMRNDVDYAMVWHLLEDRTKGSGWKCGLVEYDGSKLIKTPNFDVFKLIANTMQGRYLTSFISDGNYIVAARNDAESAIHVLIINPHASRQEIALTIPG